MEGKAKGEGMQENDLLKLEGGFNAIEANSHEANSYSC